MGSNSSPPINACLCTTYTSLPICICTAQLNITLKKCTALVTIDGRCAWIIMGRNADGIWRRRRSTGHVCVLLKHLPVACPILPPPPPKKKQKKQKTAGEYVEGSTGQKGGRCGLCDEKGNHLPTTPQYPPKKVNRSASLSICLLYYQAATAVIDDAEYLTFLERCAALLWCDAPV